jgi:hypothetical protein
MHRFLICLAVFVATTSAHATDYVLKSIYCPRQIRIELDFVKHIGSDPTFTEGGFTGSGTSEGAFKSIDRAGQKITCRYGGTGIHQGRSALYSYTAHRKIIDCKHPYNANYLQCRLEP